MKRDINFNEISDGKRYKSDDLANVSCNGCQGCSECCRVTDDTIHLDPYDICELCKATGQSFDELMGAGIISLTVVEGLITPYLAKKSGGACVFLNDEGLCRIHANRPGFCRLFPLGRIYNDDDSFDYFIQIHECPYPDKTPVLIKEWLGIPGLSKYEKYIRAYHAYIRALKNSIGKYSDTELRNVNMELLNKLYRTPYTHDGFYREFYSRISS